MGGRGSGQAREGVQGACRGRAGGLWGVVTTSMFEARQDFQIKNAAADLQKRLVDKFPVRGLTSLLLLCYHPRENAP